MKEDELIARYIEPSPHRPGDDEVRLRDYGISVWALIGYLRVVEWDVARTARDYDVPEEAVEAAVAYYRRHKDVIDTRIAANAA